MSDTTSNTALSNQHPVAFVTGASQRLGAATANKLHGEGFDIIIHYRHSKAAADALVTQLNSKRPASACCIQADLQIHNEVIALAEQVQRITDKLTVLVNNASSFYPTPLDQGTEEHWNELFASNAKAPFFL
ncbi:MAG: SDR family NAD(P)-dependent oxidoreductase, partial [Pseudomonadales bacterium]|nr:SDR family NAD(P)-dependent oxidoreductase [Pseudomonadales bacterium]